MYSTEGCLIVTVHSSLFFFMIIGVFVVSAVRFHTLPESSTDPQSFSAALKHTQEIYFYHNLSLLRLSMII